MHTVKKNYQWYVWSSQEMYNEILTYLIYYHMDILSPGFSNISWTYIYDRQEKKSKTSIMIICCVHMHNIDFEWYYKLINIKVTEPKSDFTPFNYSLYDLFLPIRIFNDLKHNQNRECKYKNLLCLRFVQS